LNPSVLVVDFTLGEPIQKTITSALIQRDPAVAIDNSTTAVRTTLKNKQAILVTFYFIWLCGLTAPKTIASRWCSTTYYIFISTCMLIIASVYYYVFVIMPLVHKHAIEVLIKEHEEQIEKNSNYY
jgi:hypothetical protein